MEYNLVLPFQTLKYNKNKQELLLIHIHPRRYITHMYKLGQIKNEHTLSSLIKKLKENKRKNIKLLDETLYSMIYFQRHIWNYPPKDSKQLKVTS